MKNITFKIGDKVTYSQCKGVYKIEKAYSSSTVFRIGNKTSFCDMVPIHMLKLYKK